MELKNAKEGERVFLREPYDDEVRETHYIRRSDSISVRYPNNVPVARVRTIQGDPLHEGAARYDTGEHFTTDPGEADGRVPVLPVSESQFIR